MSMNGSVSFVTQLALQQTAAAKRKSVFWTLERQVLAVAPFLPGSGVVADAFEARDLQRQIGMRGAVPALAVGDDVAIGRNASPRVHLPELVGGLVATVGRQVLFPFEMHGARDGSAALRSHRLAVILRVASGINDRRGRPAKLCGDVLPARHLRWIGRAMPIARDRRSDIGRQ